MFTSYLQIFIVYFILIICINNSQVSANSDIHDQTSWDKYADDGSFYLENDKPEDKELIRRGVWPRLFRSENNQPRINSGSQHSPSTSQHAIPASRIRIIPFDKRTIPIELQKALYAHGIVGRRR
jgi:hypothetical protein